MYAHNIPKKKKKKQKIWKFWNNGISQAQCDIILQQISTIYSVELKTKQLKYYEKMQKLPHKKKR